MRNICECLRHTYNMKNHFRYLCGRLVEIHSALVAPNIRPEDVLQGEVGRLLVLLEEGPAGHHVNVRPVAGLAHLLVPAVVAGKIQYLFVFFLLLRWWYVSNL